MPLTVLMIVLTLGSDGQRAAAFVDTASVPECEQRAATVRRLIGGSTTVEATICRPSAQSFDPFMHGADEDEPRHAYLIAHDDAQVTVRAVDSCDTATPAAGEVCATSIQGMLAP